MRENNYTIIIRGSKWAIWEMLVFSCQSPFKRIITFECLDGFSNFKKVNCSIFPRESKFLGCIVLACPTENLSELFYWTLKFTANYFQIKWDSSDLRPAIDLWSCYCFVLLLLHVLCNLKMNLDTKDHQKYFTDKTLWRLLHTYTYSFRVFFFKWKLKIKKWLCFYLKYNWILKNFNSGGGYSFA